MYHSLNTTTLSPLLLVWRRLLAPAEGLSNSNPIKSTYGWPFLSVFLMIREIFPKVLLPNPSTVSKFCVMPRAPDNNNESGWSHFLPWNGAASLVISPIQSTLIWSSASTRVTRQTGCHCCVYPLPFKWQRCVPNLRGSPPGKKAHVWQWSVSVE